MVYKFFLTFLLAVGCFAGGYLAYEVLPMAFDRYEQHRIIMLHAEHDLHMERIYTQRALDHKEWHRIIDDIADKLDYLRRDPEEQLQRLNREH